MLGGGGSWVGSSSGSSGVNKYVRTTRFEIISSGTSGTVTLPPDSTVVLDDFGGTTDAVISKVSSSRPTFEAAVTSGGSIVATTFDSSGNFTLTGTPDSYPVVIIYRVQQFYNNFDDTSSNIIGDLYFQTVASIANTSTTGLISSADWNSFNNKQDSLTGAASTIAASDLTASKALISNASGKVAASTVSDVELGYVSGVTSAIQTQLNAKQPTITGAITTVVNTDLATNRVLVTGGTGKLGVSTTTYTEVNYVNGVTSAIQPQINGKASTALSNLASVAINSSLLPATDHSATVLLGSDTKRWNEAFIGKISDGTSTPQIDIANAALKDSAGTTQASWSSAGVKLDTLTASTVPYLNASKQFTSSAVTPTQLSYLDATSSIQTQLGTKLGTDAYGYINTDKSIAVCHAIVANSAFSVLGCAAPNGTGTNTAVTPSNTSYYTSKKILEYTASALTTAIAGWRWSTEPYDMGSGTGIGGFYFSNTFGIQAGFAATQSNRRLFCGFTAATIAPTDVNPSTLIDMFGIGFDNGDANMQFFHNDSAGTATKVDLGASFIRPTADKVNFYKVQFTVIGGSGTVSYSVTDTINNVTVTGSVNTNLPAAGVSLSPRCWVSAGGVSSAVGIGVQSIYVEN